MADAYCVHKTCPACAYFSVCAAHAPEKVIERAARIVGSRFFQSMVAHEDQAKICSILKRLRDEILRDLETTI